MKNEHLPRRRFPEVYREFYQKIFIYCQSRLKDTHEAKDICQETFIHAWKAWPKFYLKNGGTIQAFFYRIAHNLMVDFWRRKKPCSIEKLPEIESQESIIEKLEKKKRLRWFKKL